MLQRRCACGAPGQAEAWICQQCWAARVPTQLGSLARGNPSECRWCSLACSSHCPACRQGVHFLGECPRWLCGAHRAYAALDTSAWWLCPDCAFLYARDLCGSPLQARSLGPPDALAAHMSILANAVQPGAGEARRQAPSPSTSARSARAYVLWFLQSRQWTSTAHVFRAFVSVLSQTHLIGQRRSQRCRNNVLAAIAGLQGDRLVWVAGRGQRQSIRAFRGEAVAPPLARFQRPRQRRRRPASFAVAGEPAPQRRRLQGAGESHSGSA
jgi:hypothetical protein